MSVLPGLKKLWEEYRDKLEKRAIERRRNSRRREFPDVRDFSELTSSEASLIRFANSCFSQEYDYVINMFETILKTLEEKVSFASRSTLGNFLEDVTNWNSQVYVESKSQFYVESEVLFNNVENETNYIIRFRCCGKIVMEVKATTDYKDRLIRFGAKYHTGIAGLPLSKSSSKFGTTVINIEMPTEEQQRLFYIKKLVDLLKHKKVSYDDEKEIILSSAVYDLNLLETCKLDFEEEVKESIKHCLKTLTNDDTKSKPSVAARCLDLLETLDLGKEVKESIRLMREQLKNDEDFERVLGFLKSFNLDEKEIDLSRLSSVQLTSDFYLEKCGKHVLSFNGCCLDTKNSKKKNKY